MNKETNRCTRTKLLAASLLFFGSILSHPLIAQDTSFAIGSMPFSFISTPYTFAPDSLNSNQTPSCDLVCSGDTVYHLRTGYVGFDITADEIDTYAGDINWKMTFVPLVCSGGSSLTEPPVVWDYPSTWGDMGIDIDGDMTADSVKVLRPFGGCAAALGYFDYETTICISDDATGMTLDLKCFADNNASVYLNGNLIGQQSPTLIYGWTTPNLLNVSSTALTTGQNTIKIRVANFGQITSLPQDPRDWFPAGDSSYTAMAAYARIEVETGCVTCCNDKGLITGFKYNDVNNDGIFQSYETPVSGIQIDLLSGMSVVQTTTTNSDGFFYFYVDAGTYSVQEVATQTNTVPGTGIYTGIDIDPYGIVGNLLFMNAEYDTQPCTGCGTSFQPEPGENYWFSAWVRVDHPTTPKTYAASTAGPGLEFIFLGASSPPIEYYPSGEIIDGWQRIVGRFTIPAGTDNIVLNFNADDAYATYFDDIRIHPFNASMKSYVYDGETFWLVSELDDNNYATIYEYDEEGGLVRIKKETERGIVTIQETRSGTIKE